MNPETNDEFSWQLKGKHKLIINIQFIKYVFVAYAGDDQMTSN